MEIRAKRIGLGATIALHAVAAAFLLSYEPARKALFDAAPIMVDLITPPKPEQPKPLPPTELPKPKPVAKTVVQRPVELPILAAPAEAPSPVVVAPPPPAPPVEVPAPPAPAPVLTQPIYNANYLDNPKPIYPSVSRRMGEQGRVTLRVLVNTKGTADEVQVLTSSGFRRLDEAAVDAVRRWRFVPAKRGSEPVQAWVHIPIPFVLID